MIFSRKKQAEYIFDVHCHITPGVDDGSQSLEETLKMLTIAKDEGITHMLATPHFKINHRNASPQKVNELLKKVKAAAKGIGINISIYQGNEVMYYDEMCEALNEGRISTMNNTDYVLVEFMPTDSFRYIRNALDDVAGEGYQPVLAHVERYGCMVDDIENVRELKRLGVKIQTNASSITGSIGKDIKKFTHQLLKERLIDYIGTDAHRCEGSRTPLMKECAALMYKKYDEEYVDDVLYRNAMNDFFE